MIFAANSSRDETLPLLHRSPKQASRYSDSALVILNELYAVLELLGPVVFTLVNEFLPALTNVVLVGHMPSPDTKLYVDATAVLFNITSMSVVLGLASAIDTLCTQAYGAGCVHKFGEYLQGAILGFVVFLIPVFILNWYADAILILLHQDPAISIMAGTFVRYSTFGLPFLCVYELVKRLLQAEQITLPSAIVSVLGNVIHIVVGLYLTNYTSYGFLGAAIGRSVAYCCLPFLLALYFIWRPVHREWKLCWRLRPAAWTNMLVFLEFGMPGMVGLIVEWCAFEMLSLMSGLLPGLTIVLGVNSIMQTVYSLVYMLYVGIGTAACIRIGNFLGANQPELAKMSTYVCFGVTVGFCLCSGAALYFTRQYLPILFVEDAQIIERTATAMLFLIPCHMIDSINCVTTGVLRAMGKQQIGVVVLSCSYYLVGLPAAVMFGFTFHWSIEGLWAGFTCGTTVACVAYVFQLRATNWQELADEASARVASPKLDSHAFQ
ncbi:hypothetical protein Ae201684P_017469 [Aphanomyces euteiches]|nr:hypothetical protein Ae201684P_017469 [Aphanomyces euteiches]